jgi:hypothetical protein
MRSCTQMAQSGWPNRHECTGTAPAPRPEAASIRSDSVLCRKRRTLRFMVRCEPLMHNARVVRRARREADARPARSRLLFRTPY